MLVYGRKLGRILKHPGLLECLTTIRPVNNIKNYVCGMNDKIDFMENKIIVCKIECLDHVNIITLATLASIPKIVFTITNET